MMRLGTPVIAVRCSVREVQSSCQQLYCICVLLLADEDDLRDVRSAMADLSGRWQDLGVSLGIRQGNLKAIISDKPHSSSDCLRKVLTLWLGQNYRVHVWTNLSLYLLCLSGLFLESTVRFCD